MKRKSKNAPHHHKRKGGHTTTSSAHSSDVAELIVTGVSEDGYVTATPKDWNPRKSPPHISVEDSRSGPAVGVGDRILAKLRKINPHRFEAQVIRILPEEAEKHIVGIFVSHKGGGGVIHPVSHKNKEFYNVSAEEINDAQNGELVSGLVIPGPRLRGMEQARITKRLGSPEDPHAASLIASHMHRLPMNFSKAAMEEAKLAPRPHLEPGREDLRAFPLVTIDGEDARDFDDAVFAEPDSDPSNPGGFHLIVAVADVAYYVKPESALDKEAFERGNSVYFPDRVIPMLPEHLSNDLCSLRPNEDRYCLAVHLWIDAGGVTRRYKFVRAFMRSQARLTYTEVEKDLADPNRNPLVTHLFAAYKALAKERDARGTLEIQLPEYKVMFDAEGNISHIAPRLQLESHRLIEAFMIAANVAAANYLISHKAPGIYRVHEKPSEEKVLGLRKFLSLSGYSIPKGTLGPEKLNRILHQAQDRPNGNLVHSMVLRSQMQAYYSERNLGHYGLALEEYCHFTSPIRRYADLIVHRSLTAYLRKDKTSAPAEDTLSAIAQHISETERTAMLAERDAMDRYRVSYMTRHIGDVFSGTIVSVNEFGLYVALADNGINGFIPVRNLGQDFFIYNRNLACLESRNGRQRFSLGDTIIVCVVEANVTIGSLIFKPEGNLPPPSHRHSKKKSRKPQAHKKSHGRQKYKKKGA
ncbi:MAG TPA: ribonuclease R [Rickettsiales bacterium]|nr:ribonuclease R [Rickettsiales bacterium]